MKLSDKIQFVPLALTVGVVVFSIIETKTETGIDPGSGLPVTYNVIDSIIHAGIGLAFVLAMVLLKIKYWKHFFTVLLLAAMLGYIQFYPSTKGFNFGFFQIEFTGLGLLILQLAINREPIDDLMKKTGMQDSAESLNAPPNEKEVNVYLNKFASKSQNDLLEIVESGKYTPAAMEAAKRLIDKEEATLNEG